MTNPREWQGSGGVDGQERTDMSKGIRTSANLWMDVLYGVGYATGGVVLGALREGRWWVAGGAFVVGIVLSSEVRVRIRRASEAGAQGAALDAAVRSTRRDLDKAHRWIATHPPVDNSVDHHRAFGE
jgi:hypothetical protein